MTMRRANLGISLAVALLSGLGRLADRATAAAAQAVQEVNASGPMRSHARFNGGSHSGCAAARREKRRQRNIAKHPRGAA